MKCIGRPENTKPYRFVDFVRLGWKCKCQGRTPGLPDNFEERNWKTHKFASDKPASHKLLASNSWKCLCKSTGKNSYKSAGNKAVENRLAQRKQAERKPVQQRLRFHLDTIRKPDSNFELDSKIQESSTRVPRHRSANNIVVQDSNTPVPTDKLLRYLGRLPAESTRKSNIENRLADVSRSVGNIAVALLPT